MSTVQELLLSIRDSLGDLSAERWEDATLIRRLNEAQKIVCRDSKYLRYSDSIVVINLQSTYTLPSDIQAITRVLYNNIPLTIKGHEFMDLTYGNDWETQVGTPRFAITNKLDKGLIKISPIPTFIQSTNLSNANLLSIYYIKKPVLLVELTDELELDDAFDITLKHYVVGMTLRDDLDSQNRTLGNEELVLYNNELAIAMKFTSEDFTSNISSYETPYRSIT